MKLVIFSIIIAMTSLAKAASCTNMQFQTSPTVINFSSNSQFQGTFTVKANTQPGGCSFFIVFDYGLNTSYATRGMYMLPYKWPYSITKDPAGIYNIKNILDVSSENDVITGTLTSGNSNATTNVNFYSTLDTSNPWLRFGNYMDYTTAQLYVGTIANRQFVGSILMGVNYNAPKRVDLSLVPTGSAFSLTDTDEVMNFGNLTPGSSRSVDLILKYNAGYTLFASSVNAGKLKHVTENSYIPYTITFNGSQVTLSSNPTQLYREFGVSPATGKVIPIGVTIGSFGTVKSGNYTDQVLLTVQSTE
ncbi:MAG TPA: hypothetical protein VF412_15575 [Bdellovibrio sp.]|uniref:hypothetical protein n=1 Tax=Bdellovibrio sp. TaxID=28201 RepID=UPI002F1C87F8